MSKRIRNQVVVSHDSDDTDSEATQKEKSSEEERDKEIEIVYKRKELESMIIDTLKKICKSKGMKVSGTKKQLVDRILGEEEEETKQVIKKKRVQDDGNGYNGHTLNQLNCMRVPELAKIAEKFGLQYTSKMLKKDIINYIVNYKDPSKKHEEDRMELDDYHRGHVDFKISPSSLIKVLRYLWCTPFIVKPADEKKMFKWKLSLFTISKWTHKIMSKWFDNVSLAKHRCLDHYKPNVFSLPLYKHFSNPFCPFKSIRVLDIFDFDLVEMMNNTTTTRTRGGVRGGGQMTEVQSQLFGSVETLIIHSITNYNRLCSTWPVLPKVKKLVSLSNNFQICSIAKNIDHLYLHGSQENHLTYNLPRGYQSLYVGMCGGQFELLRFFSKLDCTQLDRFGLIVDLHADRQTLLDIHYTSYIDAIIPFIIKHNYPNATPDELIELDQKCREQRNRFYVALSENSIFPAVSAYNQYSVHMKGFRGHNLLVIDYYEMYIKFGSNIEDIVEPSITDYQVFGEWLNEASTKIRHLALIHFNDHLATPVSLSNTITTLEIVYKFKVDQIELLNQTIQSLIKCDNLNCIILYFKDQSQFMDTLTGIKHDIIPNYQITRFNYKIRHYYFKSNLFKVIFNKLKIK